MHWNSPNTDATNETGFTALPEGSFILGIFYELGDYGYWWSTTKDDTLTQLAWRHRFLSKDSSDLGWGSNSGRGISVRCLRD